MRKAAGLPSCKHVSEMTVVRDHYGHAPVRDQGSRPPQLLGRHWPSLTGQADRRLGPACPTVPMFVAVRQRRQEYA